MSDSGVQFPLAPAAARWRRWLEPKLGTLLLALRPDRARELRRAENLATISLADRFLIAALVRQHERAGTLGALSGLHSWMWSGSEGVKFHRQAERRFKTWWVDHHSTVVKPLKDTFAALGGRIQTLCEIGCGSGLVLEDLSRRAPEVNRLIGLDLSPAQTALNRARFADPRLKFETGDARVWIARHAQPGWAYFTNAGVLEYLSEVEVAALFETIARELRPAVFALIEPVADDYDFEREMRSRPYNFEKSLGHNYLFWLRQNDWNIHFSQDMHLERCRFLVAVASIE